jgi:hypothetical protein
MFLSEINVRYNLVCADFYSEIWKEFSMFSLLFIHNIAVKQYIFNGFSP